MQLLMNKLCIVILAGVLALPVVAAPDTTTNIFVSGKSQNSFETDLKLAEQGNAEAQNYVGGRYLHGADGVSQDYAQAKMWFEKAAVQGWAIAQNDLGYIYLQGLGVKQDYAQAKMWFEKAVAQGNANAQNNLGTMYMQGWGVKPDYAKAKALFEQAAAQGNAAAQSNLGVMYAQGWGVKQDYAKAKALFEQAAAQGDTVAQENLNYLRQNGLIR